MRFKFNRHSLQFQLAWRLVAVFALATAVLAIGVFLEAREITHSPEDWILECQAENSAQLAGREDFVHAVLEEFLTDVAWLIPVVAGLTLLIGVFSLRRGLRPLREISAQAQRIGPRDTGVRLTAKRLPSELAPRSVQSIRPWIGSKLAWSSSVGLPPMLPINCARRWRF